jgi:tetratricopeptide (TPR) repeat protein
VLPASQLLEFLPQRSQYSLRRSLNAAIKPSEDLPGVRSALAAVIITLLSIYGCASQSNFQQGFFQTAEPNSALPLSTTVSVVYQKSVQPAPCCIVAFGPELATAVERAVTSNFSATHGSSSDVSAHARFSATGAVQKPQVALEVTFFESGSNLEITKISHSEDVSDRFTLKSTGELLVALTIVGIPLTSKERADDLRGEYEGATSQLLQETSQGIRANSALNAYAHARSVVDDALREGEMLEANHQPEEAFECYRRAFATLPFGVASGLMYPLRLRIVQVSLELAKVPELPETSRRELILALNDLKVATGIADYQSAIRHFAEASWAAPWAPEPYEGWSKVSTEMGDTLEKNGQSQQALILYRSALSSARLYLIAAPTATDGTEVSSDIDLLQEKISRMQTAQSEQVSQ